jgi:ribulose-5-phosphate 4-epimerase/fuculose-1-phosphate aldolase
MQRLCAADEETTASSLLTIDLDGDVINPGVVGDIFDVNRAGFVIHSALHRARPDARAIMHSHYAPAAGISAQRDGLKARILPPSMASTALDPTNP